MGPSPQYSYEGDEYGDTELDFSVVWDGDFPIDKPATFRGEGQGGAELGPGPVGPSVSTAFCPQLCYTSAGPSGPAAASALRLTPASTVAGVSQSTGASCGPTAQPPRPTGCT